MQVVWGSEGLPLPTCGARPEVRIVRLEDLERAGSREPRAHAPPRPSSVATISYTSGTTGTPKGAEILCVFASVELPQCTVDAPIVPGNLPIAPHDCNAH